eukprot:855779-Rhodomonas_salina.2
MPVPAKQGAASGVVRRRDRALAPLRRVQQGRTKGALVCSRPLVSEFIAGELVPEFSLCLASFWRDPAFFCWFLGHIAPLCAGLRSGTVGWGQRRGNTRTPCTLYASATSRCPDTIE